MSRMWITSMVSATRKLGLDDCVFALCLQQGHRYNVEVCGHWGHQGTAVTGGQTQRAHNDRICALRDQERNTDADGDDGEGCEAVAHDHGEQGHGDTVHSGSREQVAGRDHSADTVGNHVTDTGSSKQGAECGQDLRQDAGHANVVYQAGSIADCVGRFGLKEQQSHNQGNGTGDADGIVGAQHL